MNSLQKTSSRNKEMDEMEKIKEKLAKKLKITPALLRASIIFAQHGNLYGQAIDEENDRDIWFKVGKNGIEILKIEYDPY